MNTKCITKQPHAQTFRNQDTIQAQTSAPTSCIKNAQMTQPGAGGLSQNDQDNHSSPDAFPRIETETTKSIKHDVSTKTGVDIRQLPFYVANRANAKQAMAVEGKQVILSHQSLANHPTLLGHELVHIVQQRGGSRIAGAGHRILDRSEAEIEANTASCQLRLGKQALIHRCKERVLYQSADVSETDATNENADTNSKPLCAVFYLEDGTKEFRDPALRFVKTRPDRCYGWKSNADIATLPPAVDMAIPFKTGNDIQHALESIRANYGKLYDVYIFSHGFPGHVVSENYVAISNKKLPDFQKNPNCLYMDSLNTIIPNTLRNDAVVSLHSCSSDRASGGYENQIIPTSKLTNIKCDLYREIKSKSRTEKQRLEITEDSLNSLHYEGVIQFTDDKDPHVASILIQISGELETVDGKTIKIKSNIQKDVKLDESFSPIHIDEKLWKKSKNDQRGLSCLPEGIIGDITISADIHPEAPRLEKSLAKDMASIFANNQMQEAKVIAHTSNENEGSTKAGFNCNMLMYGIKKGDPNNSQETWHNDDVLYETHQNDRIVEHSPIPNEQKYGLYTHCRSNELINPDGSKRERKIYTPKGEITNKDFKKSTFEDN